jgi:hypothetical protein
MRLQDRFKYDPDQEGLEGRFEPIGNDSFIINLSCIWVKNQILIPGNTYFLFALDEEKETRGTAVDFIDCFYYHHMVYLLVKDVFTQEIKLLNHTVEIDFTICKWQLVDGYTLDKKIEEESLRMK